MTTANIQEQLAKDQLGIKTQTYEEKLKMLFPPKIAKIIADGHKERFNNMMGNPLKKIDELAGMAKDITNKYKKI